MGETTLSADVVASEIFNTPAVQARLAHASGLAAGFSRSELRQALARSEDVRREVNRLMHPLVMERILASQDRFVEVPLLIEACLQSSFDRIWVITCGPQE